MAFPHGNSGNSAVLWGIFLFIETICIKNYCIKVTVFPRMTEKFLCILTIMKLLNT